MAENFWKNAALALAGTLLPPTDARGNGLTRSRAAAFFEKTLRKALALAETGFAAAAETGMPKIACACSGGADSLSALLLFWAKFPELRARTLVLHYDHAVRAESAADADFVREVAAALGLEFASERREKSDFCGNAETEKFSEADLRALRLDFFERKMHERGAGILVQGHQRDDVAETLLMRISRGAGTAGLAAPRAISIRRGGEIFVRPLLEFPKSALCDALRRDAIPWREDATNAGTDSFRTRVRNSVLPALRAVAPFTNFERSRRLAEEDADALDFLAQQIFEKSCRAEIPPRLAGTREFRLFADAPQLRPFPALARRVLLKIFDAEKIVPAGAETSDALAEALCAGTPIEVASGGRKIALDAAGTLTIFPENSAPAAADASNFDGNAREQKFAFARERPGKIFSVKTAAGAIAEAEIVALAPDFFPKLFAGAFPPEREAFVSLENWRGSEIVLRAALAGEKLRPLGAPGAKKLGDIFTDKKIPPAERAILPIFADAEGAAWAPGIAPAERLKLAGNERSALRLTYRRDILPLCEPCALPRERGTGNARFATI